MYIVLLFNGRNRGIFERNESLIYFKLIKFPYNFSPKKFNNIYIYIYQLHGDDF